MSAAVKERLKSADDSFDINKRFAEKLCYEFTLGTSFAESYRRNYLVMHLHLSGCANSSRDLCITFNSGHAESNGRIATTPTQSGRSKHSPALQKYHWDVPVFVDICELVNDESGISLVSLPVIVGLETLDNCNCRGRDFGESFPKIGRIPEFIFGCTEGERMLFGGLATIGNNYFVNEIVKGGPQVLSAISYGEGDADWDGMERLKTHDGAIDVSICIQHGITGVALSVPVTFGFKNLEMMFSPSELFVD